MLTQLNRCVINFQDKNRKRNFRKYFCPRKIKQANSRGKKLTDHRLNSDVDAER